MDYVLPEDVEKTKTAGLTLQILITKSNRILFVSSSVNRQSGTDHRTIVPHNH